MNEITITFHLISISIDKKTQARIEIFAVHFKIHATQNTKKKMGWKKRLFSPSSYSSVRLVCAFIFVIDQRKKNMHKQKKKNLAIWQLYFMNEEYICSFNFCVEMSAPKSRKIFAKFEREKKCNPKTDWLIDAQYTRNFTQNEWKIVLSLFFKCFVNFSLFV